MARWRCYASGGGVIQVGRTIFATQKGGDLIVDETVRRMSGTVIINKGESLPIKGHVWKWERIYEPVPR